MLVIKQISLCFSLLSLIIPTVCASPSEADTVEIHQLIRKARSLSSTNEAGAQELYTKALKCADSLNFQDEMVVTAIVARADFETYNGKLDSSIYFSLKALKYYEDQGNKKEMVQMLGRIGDVLRGNGMYDKSYDYFHQALNLLTSLNDSNLLAAIYNRMAASYFEDPRISLDTASKYATLSLAISRKLDIQRRIFNNLNILGSIETKRGNYEKALDLYYQALPILLNVAPHEEPLVLTNMARNYELLNNFRKAEELSLRSLELARKYNIPQYIGLACLNLTTIYKKTGKYEKAFTYLDLYHEVQARLMSQRVLVQVQDFDNRIAMQKKVDENRRLEYEQKITKGRFQFAFILSILLFFILLSTVGFLIFQQRQRRKMDRIVAKLDQSNLVQRRFISILAHDLRSPFNSILGFSEILKNDTNLSREEHDMAVNALYSSSHSAFQLLERLLEWSRLQSGAIQPEKKPFNLNDQITETFSLLEHNAGQKRISLEFNTQTRVDLFTDPDMIHTAIRNIVSNAIKFTHPGGSVKVSLETRNNQVLIIVKDTGIGMTPDAVSYTHLTLPTNREV